MTVQNHPNISKKKSHKSTFKDIFDEDFYEEIPKCPGIYLILNLQGKVIFIGRSKNIRQRIQSYRYVRPQRSSSNALKIVRDAFEIQWETCRNEKQAELKANYLIKKFRPLYNTYATSTDSYRYIGFSHSNDSLSLLITAHLKDFNHYLMYGSFRDFDQTMRGYSALLRLMWAITMSKDNLEKIPVVLLKHQPPKNYKIDFQSVSLTKKRRWIYLLKRFLKGTAIALVSEIKTNLDNKYQNNDSFLKQLFDNDMNELTHFYRNGPELNYKSFQKYHLNSPLINHADLDDLLDNHQE